MNMDTVIHYALLVAQTLIINEILAVIVPPLFMVFAGIMAIKQARRLFGISVGKK